MRPNTDVGQRHPPSLSWHKLPDREVSHVVVGGGSPGGLWHSMPPGLKTLSMGSWLEQPGYSFDEWVRDKLGVKGQDGYRRVPLEYIAEYYAAYTKRMGLEGNFLNHTTIANVVNLESHSQPSHSRNPSVSSTLSSSSSSSSSSTELLLESDHDLDLNLPPGNSHTTPTPNGPLPSHTPLPARSVADDLAEYCQSDDSIFSGILERAGSPDASFTSDSGVRCATIGRRCVCSAHHRWCLRGCTVSGDKQTQCVVVYAKRLVLACGIGGSPRKLRVPGEDLEFVSHTSANLHLRLASALKHTPDCTVVIVGAGISAADTILYTLSQGARVYHVFRRAANDRTFIYHRMYQKTYPEYRRVFDLMRGKISEENYTSYAEHTVSRFASSEDEGGVCVIRSTEGEETSLSVSLAQIESGSVAKLDFLPDNLIQQLPIDPDKPVSIDNPVDINPLSFESERVEGLYALGSLAGENFVRFVLGGALGVVQHLQQNP